MALTVARSDARRPEFREELAVEPRQRAVRWRVRRRKGGALVLPFLLPKSSPGKPIILLSQASIGDRRRHAVESVDGCQPWFALFSESGPDQYS
jgi:hypothetical protein